MQAYERVKECIDCLGKFSGNSERCTSCRFEYKKKYNIALRAKKIRAKEAMKTSLPFTPGKPIITGMFGTL